MQSSRQLPTWLQCLPPNAENVGQLRVMGQGRETALVHFLRCSFWGRAVVGGCLVCTLQGESEWSPRTGSELSWQLQVVGFTSLFKKVEKLEVAVFALDRRAQPFPTQMPALRSLRLQSSRKITLHHPAIWAELCTQRLQQHRRDKSSKQPQKRLRKWRGEGRRTERSPDGKVGPEGVGIPHSQPPSLMLSPQIGPVPPASKFHKMELF